MPELNLIGRTLGRYEIIAPLGSGGMAVVYRARQTDLERVVALKILPPELGLDKSYIARFIQEARSAAALEHPHIVPIFDVGAVDGLHYIAMKYIQGETLKDLGLREGALSLPRVVGLLEQVAGALDYAHSQGVIHRDIKPSNMMVERGGWVYLTDFGLARGGASGGLTMAGTVMGTPEYMSPEQAQGLANLGPASDIYALGVVLYELLTGRMPFQADTPMGMLVARLQYAPTPPRDHRVDLPMEVEDVLMRALARRPEARFQSAAELMAALRRAAGLGSQPGIEPQRPLSPPQGTPFAQAPRSPAPTPAPNPAHQQVRPPAPAAPTAAGAPTLMAGGAPSTPAPLGALPPMNTPAPVGSLPPASTVPAAGPAPRPERRSRRGPAITAGVVVAALVLGGVGIGVSRQRGEEAVGQQLLVARTAFERRGGLDEALAAYERAAELRPGSAEAHTRLALIYLLRERYAEAQEAADDAIDAEDGFSLAHAVRAEALNSLGEYDDALAAAERAIELDAEHSQGYAVRATIKSDRAVKTTDQDLLDEALADAERAVELAGGRENLMQAMAYNARGFVYWQQYLLTDDTAMADRGGDDFNRAIGLQPQIAVFYSNLGYFYNAQGSQALGRGDQTGAESKLDLARTQFERAQEADPEYGHAHAGLGWNLYYLEDYDGALGEFQKAVELNDRDSDALTGIARTYLDRPEPDYDKAIEALGQAADVAERDPGVFSATGWAYMSRGFSQEERSSEQVESYQEAEQSFRQAIELNDRAVDAVTGLGWALRARAYAEDDADLYDEALKELDRSVQIRDDQPDAHFGIGWVYYGQGDYESAEDAFRRAIELNDDDGGNYYWLGLTLQELGRTDEAREAYQAAVDRGNSFAQEALDGLE